jgi:hypothetical protein
MTVKVINPNVYKFIILLVQRLGIDSIYSSNYFGFSLNSDIKKVSLNIENHNEIQLLIWILN